MKKINIELTEQEAKNLVQALDLATKAGGLNVAVLALPIARMVEEQLYAQTLEQGENTNAK
jgi:hypothetical protein